MESVVNFSKIIGEPLTHPVGVGVASSLYLVVTLWLGPAFMASRKPYNITPILVAYNAFQVLWNAHILYLVVENAHIVSNWLDHCTSDAQSIATGAWPEEQILWAFYMSKYLDWFDTLFFILRKKDQHISFLHVYHHFGMAPSTFVNTVYIRDIATLPPTILNTSVHLMMYTYYMLSAMGPNYAKFIWWKKYITRIQLAQFVIVMLIQVVSIGCGCNLNRPFAWYVLISNILVAALFANFYVKAYRSQKKIN